MLPCRVLIRSWGGGGGGVGGRGISRLPPV